MTLEDLPTLAEYVAEATDMFRNEFGYELRDGDEEDVWYVTNVVLDLAVSNGSSDYSGALATEWERADKLVRQAIGRE